MGTRSVPVTDRSARHLAYAAAKAASSAAVDDQDFVPALVQLLNHSPAEEPRPAYDQDPHGLSLAHQAVAPGRVAQLDSSRGAGRAWRRP
jgi:hypothetical protein